MNPLLILAYSSITFLVAILAFPLLIKLLHRWELLDHPADHKIHSEFTPSMGGICILLAVVIALLIAFPLQEWGRLRYFFISLAVIFVVGLRDDILILTPGQKLLGQLLPIALVVFLGEVRITSLFGLYPNQFPAWISWGLSVFVLVALTNSYNLIDGIDGLAGIISALIFAVLGIWFWMAEDYYLAILAGIFFGAIAGFLQYNWAPSRIFMGDTGTLPIGFTMSVLVIIFLEKNFQLEPAASFRFNASVGAALCLFIVPVFDTVRVVILRVFRGQSPFRADHNHLHHQLLRIGLSHAGAALVLVTINVAFIALAWVGKNWSDPLLLMLAAGSCTVIAVIFQVVEKKRNARKN